MVESLRSCAGAGGAHPYARLQDWTITNTLTQMAAISARPCDGSVACASPAAEE